MAENYFTLYHKIMFRGVIMNQAIVGIDIGLKGAIVVLCTDKTIMVFDTPLLTKDDGGDKYNIKRMAEIAQIIKKENPIVFIEKAITLPKGFSIKVATSLAYCEGMMEALMTSFDIQYRLIHPKTWQKVFGIKKTETETTKDQSMKLAKELFPSVSLETPRGRQLDGRADALLIAEAGKRILEAESKKIF